MARKKTSLDDPFAELTGDLEERINPDDELTSNTETKNVSETLNSNTEQETVSEVANSNTEQKVVSAKVDESITNKLVVLTAKEYEKSIKKVTKEDTHTRITFLLDNNLKKRLDKLCENKERGFKTSVLNDAVEIILQKFGK